MDARELIMVLGLAVLLIYLGVYPQPFFVSSAAATPGMYPLSLPASLPISILNHSAL